jgi:hypothetical protein
MTTELTRRTIGERGELANMITFITLCMVFG